MKFAKEIEDDLVPEWRTKYLNYKVPNPISTSDLACADTVPKEGKKKIKAVARALREANRTPRPRIPQLDGGGDNADDVPDEIFPLNEPFTHYDFDRPRRPQPSTGQMRHSYHPADAPEQKRQTDTLFADSPPVLVAESDLDKSENPKNTENAERSPLRMGEHSRLGGYGSFRGSGDRIPEDSPDSSPELSPNLPPEESPEVNPETPRATSSATSRPGITQNTTAVSERSMKELELPDPAMTPSTSAKAQPPSRGSQPSSSALTSANSATPAFHSQLQSLRHGSLAPTPRKGSLARMFMPKRQQTWSGTPSSHVFSRSKLRQIFRPQQLDSPYADNVHLEAYKNVDARQAEFFKFLEKELKKVEDFYKSKEDEATHRLTVLRRQLHELRDRRMEEVQKAQRGEVVEGEEGLLSGDVMNFTMVKKAVTENGGSNGHSINPLKPIGDMLSGKQKLGRTTKSLMQQTSPNAPPSKRNEDNQDYVRRRDPAPSFRVAKRRLKLALQEFYRGLELLKSYTILNRTAFRKINKKYDKAVNARPTMQYYSSRVEDAYFVKSDIIGGHLVAVEDLYARYFEKGNHKIAVNKLRSKVRTRGHSATSFRNGLYLSAGVCFGISGLTTALDRLFNPASEIVFLETSYLLQIYGGYFLALLLFLIFALDCKVWVVNRINYQFIFEFDTRHTLDWREMSELPCFFLFLNGLFLWLNFRQDHGDPFYLHWPIVLAAITLAIMALPFRILYYDARRWFGYSNWRLFFAGLYPVEFRDFYLGDMFCSLTYSMAQIELFFCLYVNDWNNPRQCNSNHSRLLGFLTTLPAIWRALQCLRRYKDSGKSFPHLANFAKYLGNIIYYMTLSMYRIHISGSYRAVFITFALINGLYCSIWDVLFDWSLGDLWSNNFLLRDKLAYKKKRIYYAAIPIDVILRQQWIFYAIFTEDLQHSSAVSFFVGLAEVLRRGMWSLFRVENEHCNNVSNFRASRDIPLPYKLDDDEEEQTQTSKQLHGTPTEQALHATGADLEQATTAESGDSSLRQRKGGVLQTPTFRALQRVGTVIAGAHASDFEKKRKSTGQNAEQDDEGEGQESSDDEDEEAMEEREDSVDVHEADKMVRRAARGKRS